MRRIWLLCFWAQYLGEASTCHASNPFSNPNLEPRAGSEHQQKPSNNGPTSPPPRPHRTVWATCTKIQRGCCHVKTSQAADFYSDQWWCGTQSLLTQGTRYMLLPRHTRLQHVKWDDFIQGFMYTVHVAPRTMLENIYDKPQGSHPGHLQQFVAVADALGL